MEVKISDVLKVEFVLVGFGLLGRAGEFEAFRARYPEARISGNSVNVDVVSNVSEQGKAISLDRDRITMELFPSRSTIRREYPQDLGSFGHLADITSDAINITAIRGQHLRAYGFNLDIVFAPESSAPAHVFLAKKLFKSVELMGKGEDIIGGSARIVYLHNEDQWQVTLEPRFGDPATPNVYLNLNLHKDRQQLPTKEELNDSLVRIWEQAKTLVDTLDHQEC